MRKLAIALLLAPSLVFASPTKPANPAKHPATAAAKPTTVDELDYLRLDDFQQRMSVLNASIELGKKQLEEMKKDYDKALSAFRVKYQLGPKDTVDANRRIVRSK